jgi:hypothetical protein
MRALRDGRTLAFRPAAATGRQRAPGDRGGDRAARTRRRGRRAARGRRRDRGRGGSERARRRAAPAARPRTPRRVVLRARGRALGNGRRLRSAGGRGAVGTGAAQRAARGLVRGCRASARAEHPHAELRLGAFMRGTPPRSISGRPADPAKGRLDDVAREAVDHLQADPSTIVSARTLAPTTAITPASTDTAAIADESRRHSTGATDTCWSSEAGGTDEPPRLLLRAGDAGVRAESARPLQRAVTGGAATTAPRRG